MAADAAGAVLAGASVANPWLGLAGGFATGLGQALGSSGGPSNAAGRSEAVFDNSGWNITFGTGDITAKSDKTTSNGSGGMLGGGDYTTYFMLAVGAVILWRMTRNTKA